MMAWRRLAPVLLAISALLAACARNPAPVAVENRAPSRVAFSDLPGWRDAKLDDALAAFARGCAVLARKPDAAAMGLYAGTAADWREVCADAHGDARQFFESCFTAFAMDGPALYTGYYEPQIAGSRTRHDAFTAPAYGLPPDLVMADLAQFGIAGEHISGRVEGHGLRPYPARAQIEANGANGAPVLLYADPVDIFYLQIQGSGRVTLDDGGSIRLAYAGENGRPYTAIGRTLIAEGAMGRENMSMQAIRAWLAAHPDQAQRVMNTNQSYVFFQEMPLGDAALGATGTLGVPLMPLANIAVDPRIHMLGAPFYVAADGPDPVRGLMIGSDTGGAIRGAARADIFFGFGPDAERRAGGMNAGGKLFLLLPNAVAAKAAK